MEQNVAKYFEIRAAQKIASDKAYAKRGEIADRDHINLGDAQDDPEYKVLDEVSTRLYWEADMLTPYVIRENLARLDLEDPVVTVVIDGRNGEELGRIVLLLSDACGLRYSNIGKQLGISTRKVSLRVRIIRDGQQIGHMDSDGVFDFEAAPDLKTALGWKVATDGGRTILIEGFDLDSAARMLLEAIRVNGTCKEAFNGPYFKALERIFVYEKTSRFTDGYCGAATTLWRVATRELGQEHEGYSFCF